MNRHLEKIKEEERARKTENKKTGRYARLVSVIAAVLVIGGVLFQRTSGKSEKMPNEAGAGSASQAADLPQPQPQAPVSAVDFSADSPAEEEIPWNLILVNQNYYLPREFTVELASIGSKRVDRRIKGPLEQMMRDAAREGVVITVCSGYRSVKKQTTLYENRKDGEEAAYLYVQPPGASEHHTGLAVDFMTPEHPRLDDGFTATAAYRWLAEHAADYGFIERYPPGKESDTQVAREAWHFRFVGVKNAQYMKKFDLCLEEFCASKFTAYQMPERKVMSK